MLPLLEGHRFPIDKYARLRWCVQTPGLISGDDLRQAEPASDEQLLRAHIPEYLYKVIRGELSEKE